MDIGKGVLAIDITSMYNFIGAKQNDIGGAYLHSGATTLSWMHLGLQHIY